MSHDLFEAARADIEREGVKDSAQRTFWRWLTLEVLFMNPRLLRAAGVWLRWNQRSGLDRLARKLRPNRLLLRGLTELPVRFTPTPALGGTPA